MKKIAVMQPYFFPYLGYFSLIKHTDEFILLDTVQFIRHGWIERNRVLKQNGDWLYIKVPLIKHPHDTLIKDIKIDNYHNWREKIVSQIQIYKKIAPNYYQVSKIVEEPFKQKFSDIVSLNEACIKAVCNYLGVEANLKVFSKMNLEIKRPKAPDEWGLNICKAMKDVDEYWNPPGGKEFFDKNKYNVAGIKLKFQKINLKEYDQKRRTFEPGLSIIDLLMFNSPEEVNIMLDNYEFI